MNRFPSRRRSIAIALTMCALASSQTSLAALAEPVATPIPDVDSPAAPASVCPGVARLESRDGTEYAFVLGSAQPVTVSLNLELYTRTQEYALNLSAVDVNTPSTLRGSAFRSAALDLHDPSESPFIGASIEASPVGAEKPCAAVVVAVSSPDEVRSGPEPSTSTAPDEATIAAEFAANQNVAAPLLRVLTKSYSCGTPFASARIDKVAYPRFPTWVNASGTSLVRVDLDDRDRIVRTSIFKSSGYDAFDNATTSAAEASTYRSAVVACKRTGGSYLFTAAFQRNN